MKWALSLVFVICSSAAISAESPADSQNLASNNDEDAKNLASDTQEQEGPRLPSSIWLLGAQYGKLSSIYKDTDDEQGPMPIVAYLGKHVFWKGYELGYQINPMGSPQNMLFAVDVMAYEVDFGGSDDADMALLNERDASVMASFAYQYGPAQLKLSHDIANEHNGYSVDLGIKHKYDFKPFEIEMALAVIYQDKKLSNHLYGVSQSESDLTSGNIAAYDAKASQVSKLGVTLNYALTQNAKLALELGRNQYFKVDSSPIVEEDISFGSKMSFIYLF